MTPKLTNIQVRFIRDAYAVHMAQRREDGFTKAAMGVRINIARAFGIKPDTVDAIVRREKRRNV